MTALILIASGSPIWVENHYTYGVYPFISRMQRLLFGWIPFSLGDLIYLGLPVWVIWRFVKLLKKIRHRSITRAAMLRRLSKLLFIFLVLFVVFYGLWGLNYSRLGISGQLQLRETNYRPADLDTLVALLQLRLNHEAANVDTAERPGISNRALFDAGVRGYTALGREYPFLRYRKRSVKPSLFSYLGNYMGFQGYYNPFTGEAQVNTTVPFSEKPFVTVHEMAHQLGYARENEANFVGFLACRQHASIHFRYAGYFDMYRYALRELTAVDSLAAVAYQRQQHPRVTADIDELYRFYSHYRNPVEPLVSMFYDYFLKANRQPRGTASYSEVVRWLIAYYKKYGKETL
ncbi:DUF3810 domain-containing protein [Niabella terrae]